MTSETLPPVADSPGAAPSYPAARRLALFTLVLSVLVGVGAGVIWSRAQRSSDTEARIIPIEGRVLEGGQVLESFSGRLILVERTVAPRESIWLLLRRAGDAAASEYLPASLQLRLADSGSGIPEHWIAGIATLAVPGRDLHWFGRGSVEPALEAGRGSSVIQTVWTHPGGTIEVELNLTFESRTPAAAAKTIVITAEELDAVWRTWVEGTTREG